MNTIHRIIITITLITALSGCNSKHHWSEQQKQAFYDLCFNGTIQMYDANTSKKYCDCMLNTIIKKYPDPESVDAITMDEMHYYASECM